MPYIKREEREELASFVNELKETVINGRTMTPGTLNFLITVMVHAYVERRGTSYSTLNDVMGVLASAQAEFYRRVVAPYENKKIEENGNV
jgi:hypothetical protein